MSTDLDGYEPAIDQPDTGAPDPSGSAASAPTAASVASEAAEIEAAEKVGLPPGEDDPAPGPQPGPKAPRVWSQKSRTLFRQLAAKGGVGFELADELVPVEHQAAAAPAQPVAAPATGTPAAQVAPPIAPAAAAQPVTPPPGLPELPDITLPVDLAPVPPAAAPAPDPRIAEREQAIASREAELTAREALLPDRRRIIDDPGGTTIAWLKDTYGITDDNDLKTAVADLITDLSVKGLKIGVPDEHVNGMNSRRATRMVKVYSSDVDKRERQLKDREAAAEKKAAEERSKVTTEQQEAAYVAKLGDTLAPSAAALPFLHDGELTGGAHPGRVVYEVMVEQRKQAEAWASANPGKRVPDEILPNLKTAALFAEKYYRDKAEAIVNSASRFQQRLKPAPAAQPAAPAKPQPNASPGGAPGPAPTQAAKPEPQPTRDPSDAVTDEKARRRASLQKIRDRNRAASGAGNQPT